jgi:O-antigen/teichoic acid export membrane protein
VFSRPILGLLTTPAFQSAAPFVPFITACYVIRGLGDQFRNVFFLENQTVSDAKTSTLGSILCLLGYVTLIPLFKMWGAVAATLGAFTCVAAYSYWKAQQIKKYHYEVKRLLKIGFCAVVAVVVAQLGMPEGLGPQFLVGIGGIVLYLVLLATSGFFTREELLSVREFGNYLSQRATKVVGAS